MSLYNFSDNFLTSLALNPRSDTKKKQTLSWVYPQGAAHTWLLFTVMFVTR